LRSTAALRLLVHPPRETVRGQPRRVSVLGKLTEWLREQREAARQASEVEKEHHAGYKQERARESETEQRQREASWQRIASNNWQHRLGVDIREAEVYE